MVMLTRIGLGGLTSNRLDPTYYRPEHLRDAELRGSWSRTTLDKIRSSTAPIVYGVLKPDDTGQKFRVVKAERFDGMFVSASDCDPVSEEMFRQFARAEALDGDLLVAIGGYVGRPAMVRVEDGLRVVVNRHLARIRIDKSRADPAWVLAYFSSPRGERQLTREITGSVQAGINLCDLRLVDVPLPAAEAQQYIGDKVRLAEQLRERARNFENIARLKIAAWNGGTVPPTFREAPRRTAAMSASPHSLGPNFAWAMAGHANIPDALLLSEMIESCSCGDPIRADQRVAGPYLYYGASGPIDTHNASNFDGEYLIVAQDGTIGCACVARGRFWANNHVWVLKLLDGVDPDAVAAYLDGHYKYWAGLTTGSVVPKVTSENLLLAAIPRAVAYADDVGAKLRLAGESRVHAESLARLSKVLVERLIEGKVTEADLVAAQKALEVGDRTADRTILNALRSDSGQPSIADLDGLYAVLDELDPETSA